MYFHRYQIQVEMTLTKLVICTGVYVVAALSLLVVSYKFYVGSQAIFAPFENEKIYLIFGSHPFPFCDEVLEILQET